MNNTTIQEIMELLDNSTVTYFRPDLKYGKYHKFGVVDREKAANAINAHFLTEALELIGEDEPHNDESSFLIYLNEFIPDEEMSAIKTKLTALIERARINLLEDLLVEGTQFSHDYSEKEFRHIVESKIKELKSKSTEGSE